MNEEWIRKEMIVFQDMCATYFERHLPKNTSAVAVLHIVGNLSVYVHDALHRAMEEGKKTQAKREIKLDEDDK